jgi:protein-S-isoprenylcysteine O-methyltransferase Ste14
MGSTPIQFSLVHAAVFKLRGVLMLPLVVLLLLCTRWEWEYDPGIWSLGLLFFLSGTVLRFWAQRHLQYRTGRQRKLAVTGPYQYVRNPVYLGNVLVLIGLAVLCELVWAVPLVVLWTGLVYASAVKFEAARLAGRYGADYERYCEAVLAWCPRLHPLFPGLSCPRRDPAAWGGVFAAEWQCFALLLIPAVKECFTDSVAHQLAQLIA